jgi:hypothetical protein
MRVIVSGAMRVSMRMSVIMGMTVSMIVAVVVSMVVSMVVAVSMIVVVVVVVRMVMVMVAMGQRIQLGMQGMIKQIQAQRIQLKQCALSESDRIRGSFDTVSGNAFTQQG